MRGLCLFVAADDNDTLKTCLLFNMEFFRLENGPSSIPVVQNGYETVGVVQLYSSDFLANSNRGEFFSPIYQVDKGTVRRYLVFLGAYCSHP